MIAVRESGLLSVAVPVVLIIIALAAALGLYVMKHYRLRNSFTSFANSHYSTSSGAAIFTDRLGKKIICFNVESYFIILITFMNFKTNFCAE